jgi:hypothetical protein
MLPDLPDYITFTYAYQIRRKYDALMQKAYHTTEEERWMSRAMAVLVRSGWA